MFVLFRVDWALWVWWRVCLVRHAVCSRKANLRKSCANYQETQNPKLNPSTKLKDARMAGTLPFVMKLEIGVPEFSTRNVCLQ